MKKPIFFLLFILFSFTAYSTTYYVSPTGDDSNNGTSPSTPFLSINKLNTLTIPWPGVTIMSPGDSVLFERDGIYRGEWVMGRNGTLTDKVVISAYGTGAKPVIAATTLVTGWTLHSGNIYKATVSQEIKKLYINDNRMILARYPNSGWLYMDSKGNANTSSDKDGFTDAALSQPANYWDGAMLRIRSNNYSCEFKEVLNYDGVGGITMATTEHPMGPGNGYYLDNKLSEIDMPNEWFYDTNTNTLYLWAPGGVDPNTLDVEGVIYDYGIKGGDNWENVILDDLCFKYQWIDGVRVFGYSAKYNLIQNCEFAHQEEVGLLLMGEFHEVKNNLFRDIAGQGLAALELRDSDVNHNTVKRVGMQPGFGISGTTGMIGMTFNSTVRSNISYNNLDSTGYTALNVNVGYSKVERNIIRNALAIMDDGGAIQGYKSGTHHSTFKNNFVYDTQGTNDGLLGDYHYIINAIYLDVEVASCVVDSNTVINSRSGGILFNSGTDSCVARYNNVYGGLENFVIAEWLNCNTTSNHVVKHNTFYGLEPGAVNVRLVTFCNTYDSWANFDSNYYGNPYSDIVLRRGNFGNTPNYSFDDWKAILPQYNANSKKAFVNNDLNLCTNNGYVSGNLVTNSTFDTNNNNWGNNQGNAYWMANSPLDGGAYQYNVNIHQGGFIYANDVTGGFEEGKHYEYKMSAISTTPGTNLRVGYRQNGGNYWYLWPVNTHEIGTTRTEITGIMSSDHDEPIARLELEIADDVSSHDIIIDNVEVREVNVTCPSASDKSKIFVNETTQPLTIPLVGAWLDLDSNLVTGSITLPPYYSRILIRGSAIGVFPVELLSFEAEPLFDGTVGLEWAVTREEGLDKYIIERSLRGQFYEKIGEVNSRGNSEQLYNYIDEHPFPNGDLVPKIHYRLKMQDLDGSFSYSNVEVVNLRQPGKMVQVSPNPASDFIRINHPGGRVFNVCLYNVSGQKVLSTNIKGDSKINLEGLIDGIYLIRVFDMENESYAPVYTGRVVKQ